MSSASRDSRTDISVMSKHLELCPRLRRSDKARRRSGFRPICRMLQSGRRSGSGASMRRGTLSEGAKFRMTSATYCSQCNLVLAPTRNCREARKRSLNPVIFQPVSRALSVKEFVDLAQMFSRPALSSAGCFPVLPVKHSSGRNGAIISGARRDQSDNFQRALYAAFVGGPQSLISASARSVSARRRSRQCCTTAPERDPKAALPFRAPRFDRRDRPRPALRALCREGRS